jgi:predicted RNA-binding Zn-ribbon protein involved in translation (DUF1610 family)
MNISPFADMPDDLDFATPTPAGPMQQIASPRYVAAPVAATHRHACTKCKGSGTFRSYTGRSLGECFVCKGAGFQEFKTSPQQRVRAAEQRVARKERAEQNNLDTFAEEHPAAYEWMVAQAPRFDFAASMLGSLKKWGRLTDNQLAAVERCVERDRERTAKRAAEAAAAPAVPEMHKFWEVLQRHAKFYAGKLTISRRNQDQLCWIKHEDAEKVIGKIDHGQLTLWSRPGVDMNAVREQLTEFEGAPLQAAMRWGKLAGRCCSCGRDLTDPASIEAGIGPICATKFG